MLVFYRFAFVAEWNIAHANFILREIPQSVRTSWLIVGVALRGPPALNFTQGWPRRATPTINSLRPEVLLEQSGGGFEEVV